MSNMKFKELQKSNRVSATKIKHLSTRYVYEKQICGAQFSYLCEVENLNATVYRNGDSSAQPSLAGHITQQ